MDEIKVFAPASIGNIGPGFDVLGMAVDISGDEVEVRKIKGDDVLIKEIIGNKTLSKDPDKNTAGIAAKEVLKALGEKKGLEIILHKVLPIGSGLGSSAASAVAAGFAVNCLFDNRLEKEDLIYPITKAEEVVSGSFFSDNVASSLLGGVVLMRSYDPFEIVKLGYLEDTFIALVRPEIEIITKDARDILPNKILLKDMIKNNANTSGIVAGVLNGDVGLFGRSVDDQVIEKHRKKLIPGFDDVKKAALKNGAFGCSIAGAGPTVFAVCDSNKIAQDVANAMKKEFEKAGLDSNASVSKMDTQGARIIS